MVHGNKFAGKDRKAGRNFQLAKTIDKGEKIMETWYYEVVSIDGDYANLKRTDIELDDVKLVARALLPAEIVVGSKLKYEMLQYEIIF